MDIKLDSGGYTLVGKQTKRVNGSEVLDPQEVIRLESAADAAMAVLDLPPAQHRVECTYVDQAPLDLGDVRVRADLGRVANVVNEVSPIPELF